MNKIISSVQEAVSEVRDGSVIALGGFGLCGIPEKSIAALVEKNVRDLTCISNNAGVDDFGIGLLLQKQQVKKMIASYVGENKLFESLMLSGKLEVELVPQGTLAERLRAAGAGIAGFYTPTGVGTPIAEGKEVRCFHEREYVLEEALCADVAFVKAWKADAYGNLMYRKTARNFNPLCAMAGKITIAEVEEIVEVGAMDPDQVHTSGVYVQKVFLGAPYEKRIERLKVQTQ